MKDFRKSIYRTSNQVDTPAAIYCAVWEAHNESNIRMSTTGYIDFTEILAGRNIQGSPASAGTITAYKFAGDPVWVTTTIPMSFTLKRATWNTNTLPYRLDQVLTGIRFSIEIICTNATELPSIENNELFAVVDPGSQLDAYYDTCS